MPKPPHGHGARECPLQVIGPVERESALGVVFSVATTAHRGGASWCSSASEMVAHAYARRFFCFRTAARRQATSPGPVPGISLYSTCFNSITFFRRLCLSPVFISYCNWTPFSCCLRFCDCSCAIRPLFAILVCVLGFSENDMPASNPSLWVHVLVTVTYCNPPCRERWLRLLCRVHNFMLFVLRYTCGLPHALGFPRTTLRGTCRCCAPSSIVNCPPLSPLHILEPDSLHCDIPSKRHIRPSGRGQHACASTFRV